MVHLSSLGRRLGRLEVAHRRSWGIDAFAHVAQDELDQAMQIFEEAFATSDFSSVNDRLAMHAPAVLAAGSPSATRKTYDNR